MRPSHVLRVACLAALLLACGCSSSNKGKIEGTKWSSKAATPAGQVHLEFQADGKMVYKIGAETHTGTYGLGMGPSVTMNFDTELTGRKTHVEKIIINGDELTMTDSNGTQVAFQKVK